MHSAPVFNIQKFSLQDGPGIRTSVFLKGCPLRCQWCHNPESQTRVPEIFFYPENCVHCGHCGEVCPRHCHLLTGEAHLLNREKCTGCGVCADQCPTAALKTAGKTKSVAEVMTEVLQDRLFYENSGGGITLSGGEPFYHLDFALELLAAAKNSGLHTCVETCGFFPFDQVRPHLDLVDLWLYDIKATGTEKHRQLTGKGNELILENLHRLDRHHAKLILRCPLVPGVNDDLEHFRELGALASRLTHVERIEIEPYHDFGICKSRSLGRKPDLEMASATTEQVAFWLEQLRQFTDVPVQKA